MRHRSGQLQLRSAGAYEIGDGERLRERPRPEPPHARVELDVDPDDLRGARLDLGDELLGPGGQLGAGGECNRELLGADRAEHEHRRRDPGVAEHHRLARGRDRHARGAAGAPPRASAGAGPGAWALTTAHSLASPASPLRSRATLRSIAARLTRASARSAIVSAQLLSRARGSASITSRAITPSGPIHSAAS